MIHLITKMIREIIKVIGTILNNLLKCHLLMMIMPITGIVFPKELISISKIINRKRLLNVDRAFSKRKIQETIINVDSKNVINIEFENLNKNSIIILINQGKTKTYVGII